MYDSRMPLPERVVANGTTQEILAVSQTPRRRGPVFWIVATLVAVLLVAATGTGAFFLGVGSRPSDSEITSRLASQATADKRVADARQTDALVKQRKSLTKAFKRRLERATSKAYANGQKAGYSSGYGSGAAQGRAQGEAEGRKEGRQEGELDGYLRGFDEGTCYHPDTYEYVC